MDSSESGAARRIEWTRRVLGISHPSGPAAKMAPDKPAEGDSSSRVAPKEGAGGGPEARCCLRVAGLLIAAAVLVAPDGNAQDERRLKQVFEGRRVTILLDMPATSEGVDIFPGSSRPLDFQKYSGRVKANGVAIKEGERSIVTKIRVKDDVIEVQLGGGGYGTFGDIFNSALSTNGADSGAAQQLRVSNERTQRLASGSRFNLRFPNGITPDDLEPEAIIKSLAEYATFPAGVGGRSSAPPAAVAKSEPEPAAEPAAKEPKKGMAVADVERMLGAARSTAKNGPVETRVYQDFEVDLVNDVTVDVRKRASAAGATGGPAIRKGMTAEEVEAVAGKALESKTAGQVTTNKYRWQGGTLEADFYNGVLVAYRISSGE